MLPSALPSQVLELHRGLKIYNWPSPSLARFQLALLRSLGMEILPPGLVLKVLLALNPLDEVKVEISLKRAHW